jgi:hypothetical protein
LPPETTLRALEGAAAEGRLPDLVLPRRHLLFPELDVDTRRLSKILLKTYETAPPDFAALLGTEGVGPRTLRALALASELIYGTEASTRDPARFAFAHGGKDGIPFPVDRETYDKTIAILGRAVDRSRVDHSEKRRALIETRAVRRCAVERRTKNEDTATVLASAAACSYDAACRDR